MARPPSTYEGRTMSGKPTSRARRAAEDHDLAGAARARLALLLVSRVEIRGRGRELGRAGVDALVHRPDLQLVTLVADRLLRHVEEARQAGIREPLALERAQPLGA